MNMTELESRLTPSPLIPGWDGPEMVAYGNFDGDSLADDTAVVAQPGGSARVMVFAASDGRILLNTIIFEESFRGGGRLKVIAGDFDNPSDLDSLLITAGPGGGPRVARLDLSTGDRFDFFAPYPSEFRGGLWISSGDIDGDRRPEALFLPGEGGAPLLAAVDMRTFETELSLFVGDPADQSGRARFEATGGTISRYGVLYFFIQYGETVDFRAETALFPVES